MIGHGISCNHSVTLHTLQKRSLGRGRSATGTSTSRRAPAFRKQPGRTCHEIPSSLRIDASSRWFFLRGVLLPARARVSMERERWLSFMSWRWSCPGPVALARDIQSKVAADPATKNSDVQVAAKDGKVALSGKAKSPAAQQRVGQIARSPVCSHRFGSKQKAIIPACLQSFRRRR